MMTQFVAPYSITVYQELRSLPATPVFTDNRSNNSHYRLKLHWC